MDGVAGDRLAAGVSAGEGQGDRRGASTLRRFVPAWAFDSQIRKLNQLTG